MGKTNIRYLIRISLLLILLISLNPIAGQERGVILGVGMSNFTGSEPGEQYRSVPGISLGAYLTTPITKKTSLKFTVLVMNKGALISSVGDLYLHNVLIYAGSPIHLTSKLLDLGSFVIDGELGMMPSLLILGINDLGLMENIHRWDIGLLAGISINHSAARLCLQVDQGLRKLLPGEAIDNRNRTYTAIFALPIKWSKE